MEKDYVSIIISVYNGEKYIEQTLESCSNQTYNNFEVIIIDDYSTDKSIEKISKYILKKEKFQLIKNEKNYGFIKTVNKGIELAKGNRILILDQDDILDNKHLEVMLKKFTNDTSIVFCESDFIDSSGKIFQYNNNKEKIIKKLENLKYNLSRGNFINACGLIFTKEKAIKVGKYPYDERFPNYGEWLFWLKLSSVGGIKFCDNIKSFYRRHETNMTNSFKNKEIEKILKEYYLETMKYAKKKYYYNFTLKEKIRFYLKFYKLKRK